MTSSSMKTILLVDAEEPLRKRMAKALGKRGFTVFSAADRSEAMEILAAQRPDAAVVELRLPDGSGLELVKEAKERHGKLRFVVLTGYGSIATATAAIRLGALDYLTKPAETNEILRALAGQDQESWAIDFLEEAPSLARVEWEHINRILHDCGNNISRTAKKLGIHRRTLQRKLQKYPPPERG
ncbi:MAG: response regulator [Thermodesulfobacteriota bacterium]